jgi:hypothetical protein
LGADETVFSVGAPSFALGIIIDGLTSRGLLGGCIVGLDETVIDCEPVDPLFGVGVGELTAGFTGGLVGALTGVLVGVAGATADLLVESAVGAAAITTPTQR